MKLIASDMDGTLLQNGSQQVSEEAIELIVQLAKKDVLFAVASGRQYANLRRQFKKVADSIAFICENGAAVFYQNTCISTSPINRTLALEVIHAIDERKGCEVLISSENYSYLRPKNPSFYTFIKDVVKNDVKLVQSFEEIKESIIKISVYDPAGIMNHSASYFVSRFKDRLNCTISGVEWLDLINPSISKGSALTSLMKREHISYEDTYAFGDNYNDLEMLDAVCHPYVMENAVSDIKRRYPVSVVRVEDELLKLLSSFS